jgi:hypothetical protein
VDVVDVWWCGAALLLCDSKQMLRSISLTGNAKTTLFVETTIVCVRVCVCADVWFWPSTKNFFFFGNTRLKTKTEHSSREKVGGKVGACTNEDAAATEMISLCTRRE